MGTRALTRVFSGEQVKALCRETPGFLLSGRQLGALFDDLEEKFHMIMHKRLQETTTGEWPRWKQMVEQPHDARAVWMGRIAAEERTATCKERVQRFGVQSQK